MARGPILGWHCLSHQQKGSWVGGWSAQESHWVEKVSLKGWLWEHVAIKHSVNVAIMLMYTPLTQLSSVGALAASTLCLSSLHFPNTGEEVIDSGRQEAHKVMGCVVAAATLGSSVQLLVILCRLLNFQFASTHSSMIHVLVSASLG